MLKVKRKWREERESMRRKQSNEGDVVSKSRVKEYREMKREVERKYSEKSRKKVVMKHKEREWREIVQREVK